MLPRHTPGMVLGSGGVPVGHDMYPVANLSKAQRVAGSQLRTTHSSDRTRCVADLRRNLRALLLNVRFLPLISGSVRVPPRLLSYGDSGHLFVLDCTHFLLGTVFKQYCDPVGCSIAFAFK